MNPIQVHGLLRSSAISSTILPFSLFVVRFWGSSVKGLGVSDCMWIPCVIGVGVLWSESGDMSKQTRAWP